MKGGDVAKKTLCWVVTEDESMFHDLNKTRQLEMKFKSNFSPEADEYVKQSLSFNISFSSHCGGKIH